MQATYTTDKPHEGRNRELSREERMQLTTELVGERACNALAFQTRATKKLGPGAAVFLRQLLFWEGKGEDPDGWIYKSRSEMGEETGLSQRQQDKARAILGRRELVEEELRPVGPMKRQTMHYRVDLLAVMDLLYPADPDPDRLAENAASTRNATAVHVSESSSRFTYLNHLDDSAIQKNTSINHEQKIPLSEGKPGAADAASGQLEGIEKQKTPLPLPQPEETSERNGSSSPRRDSSGWSEPATESQVGAIEHLGACLYGNRCEDYGEGVAHVEELVEKRYGRGLSELTKGETSHLIERLNYLKNHPHEPLFNVLVPCPNCFRETDGSPDQACCWELDDEEGSAEVPEEPPRNDRENEPATPKQRAELAPLIAKHPDYGSVAEWEFSTGFPWDELTYGRAERLLRIFGEMEAMSA